ncbi:neuroligin-1-like isoform X2 [Chelonus insularis]|uniref:neuroligin-1-like isoform X2 n=1 Tax=Chelonus insularis TaxID=460826 RepID=UPI00158E79E4|nr:neuroligin-1-like isoform X2 [Chelonus insularis]
MFEEQQPTVRKQPLDQMLKVLEFKYFSVKTSWLLLILAFIKLETLAGPRYASRIVETRSGQVRGILQELNDRLDPVEVFRGIPYAAPPVGNLRLREPASPLSWSGVKLADTFGFVCPQIFPDVSNFSSAMNAMPTGRYQLLQQMAAYLKNQSEDCLTLNLYIPGSGFLRTSTLPDENGHLDGNLALKDITMSLGWVKENIAAFGGDPSRVTVMGHDTGAALVNFLLLTPYSKGLLHRVILLSGSALSPWSSVNDPNNLIQTVGEQLGCHTITPRMDVADCLRGVPLNNLLNVKLPEIKFIPRIGPVLPIDKNIPDPALDMERASDTFIKIPLIIGVTTAESYLDFNDYEIQFGFEENQRNRILRTFIRNSYYYHLNEILSAVKNEYTDWEKPVLHPVNLMESTMEALSDGHTVAPLMRVAFYHSRRGAQTYFFHFNYQAKDSQYPQRLGSVRGEDIPYVFGLPLILGGSFFPLNYTRQDQGVAEAILTFFTNFAKTANPNLPHNIESVDYGTEKEKARFRGLAWEQYETGSQLYLMIASKPKVKNHYRGHKMAMWLNLIPQLHQPGDEDVSMRHHHFREHDENFYIGAVRDKLHTPIHQLDTTKNHIASAICTTPNVNNQIIVDVVTILSSSTDKSEIFQEFAARHYYSTTTALIITVGVGCIFLLLNTLIFAGIYYQRYRDKKKTFTHEGSTHDPTSMTVTPIIGKNSLSIHEPPPSYATLPRTHPQNSNETENNLHELIPQLTKLGESSKTEKMIQSPVKNVFLKELKPPKPPTRTTSSLSTGSSNKKKVQIQEDII